MTDRIEFALIAAMMVAVGARWLARLAGFA